MNLQHQVCSLDLAKRLKELGVTQESYFWWMEANGVVQLWSTDRRELVDAANKEIVMARRTYTAAFTVAELGEMLPGKYIPKKYEVASGVGYRWANEHPRNAMSHINEADARAKMLIYLIENKLITL